MVNDDVVKQTQCECMWIFVGLFGQGFDEYMNLVLDEAEEVQMKTKNRKSLGEMTFVNFSHVDAVSDTVG